MTHFEYTDSLAIFDLLKINVYHGWLVDPREQARMAEVIGNLSYNELTARICTDRDSSDPEKVKE